MNSEIKNGNGEFIGQGPDMPLTFPDGEFKPIPKNWEKGNHNGVEAEKVQGLEDLTGLAPMAHDDKELVKTDIDDVKKPRYENMNSSDVNDIPSVVRNKLDGCRRENEVYEELKEKYPESEGYEILPERELCDAEGNAVIDEKTGEKRRIDFVVVKDGKVVDMIEVTSKTAPKLDQTIKEYRIRDNGGNYIKDANGNLYKIPDNVLTRIERRD